MRMNTRTANIAKTLALPVTLYAIFAVVGLIQHNAFLTTDMQLYMLRVSCVVIVVALAFALHLLSGSFDFSVGAIIYLTLILSGRSAIALGIGPWGFLALSLVIGTFTSALVGVIYIVTRIPVMVLSLGMLMTYEAVTQLIFGGGGLDIIMHLDYAMFGKTYPAVGITLACMLGVWFLLKYSRFGFQTRALAHGQKIAYETGIVEWKNVLLRYSIAGLLLGIAAVIYVSLNLGVYAAREMSSTGVMWGSVMPCIIGLDLARYSNVPIGVLMGVLSFELIRIGFTCMGIEGTLSLIVSGVILLVFVIIFENKDKWFSRRNLRLALEKERSAAKV